MRYLLVVMIVTGLFAPLFTGCKPKSIEPVKLDREIKLPKAPEQR